MYRIFYNLLESQYFYGDFLIEPHGMMEKWIVGILGRKSGERIIRQEMLNLLFLMMLPEHLFAGFSAKIIHQNKKTNEITYDLNTGFFKPIIPRFQHSIVPFVSEAN
jgi:hypothetical protein